MEREIKMKRYAIVRVDMREQRDGHYFDCPEHFEKINGRFVCAHHYGKAYFPFETCENCRYGDTKEQLIRKVAQVLIKDEMKYCQPKTEVHKRISWQNNMKLAKEIVEFLGVEE